MAASVGELCTQQGVTVEALAERSGVEATRVASIALGRWTPSPDERRRIAAALGVPVEDIAWGHATPVQHLYGHGPA
jgi:transcriptional regulator with XRE-family HTH domain